MEIEKGPTVHAKMHPLEIVAVDIVNNVSYEPVNRSNVREAWFIVSVLLDIAGKYPSDQWKFISTDTLITEIRTAYPIWTNRKLSFEERKSRTLEVIDRAVRNSRISLNGRRKT